MDQAHLSQTLDALRDAYLSLCRALGAAGGMASSDEGDLAWGMTPMPIGAFNRVVRMRIAAGQTDARVREVADRYEAAGVPASWWIDPQTTPDDLGRRLERIGLVSESVPAMRIELEAVPELDLPTGVTLAWATDRATVRAAMHVIAAGFGLPEELSGRLADLMVHLADSDSGSGVHTVVASLDGTPVASAQGIDAGGAVGIYNVATLPEARGRGIGAAVTIAVLRAAEARGARFGVLESSEMGRRVYERIGFRDVAAFQVYGPPEA